MNFALDVEREQLASPIGIRSRKPDFDQPYTRQATRAPFSHDQSNWQSYLNEFAHKLMQTFIKTILGEDPPRDQTSLADRRSVLLSRNASSKPEASADNGAQDSAGGMPA